MSKRKKSKVVRLVKIVVIIGKRVGSFMNQLLPLCIFCILGCIYSLIVFITMIIVFYKMNISKKIKILDKVLNEEIVKLIQILKYPKENL